MSADEVPGASNASASAPDARQWLLGTATEGDLLFFGRLPESTTGDFEGAVLSVGAKHARGRGLFHVGVVARSAGATSEDGAPDEENGVLCVVHAAQKGVLAQSLQETLAEIEPDEIQVYTVDVDDDKKTAAAQFALSKVGCVYNDIFSKACRDSAGAEAYYCSQLVTEAYKGAEVGFPPHKMSFGGKDGEVDEYWKEYYRQRKCAVPVGEEGSHPGKLVEAERLRLTMSARVTSKLAASLANRAAVLQRPHWIGGSAVELQGGAEFDVVQPRSGAVVARCAGATRAQTEAAIGAARAAQPDWAARPWLARGEVLRKTAQLIREHLEPLALAECEDNGKPIYEARADVASCAETFDFYAGVGSSLAGSHFPLDSSRFAYTTREPVGVVGCVGAWNYPLQTCSWKTAPALAAGNSVVYKPSPLSPLTARLLGELLQEAGLPDGVYNVVQGEGETGAALVESPQVNKVSFTGSIPTGKRIMQACAARSIKPLTLELGGKSSLIILEDADVDSAVAGAMMANFFSQGQVCSNASKVLVHRSIVGAFTERLVETTSRMKVGDPLDESTRVGAAISADHMHKVKAYIDGAVAAGAQLLYGGKRVTVPGLEGGFYLEPAILSGINEKMAVYKEEIFGSVLLVIPFDDESEALRMSNDTDMGLAAGVFTKNLSKAHKLAAQLHAGNVYVNTYNDVSPFVPFGGFGQSGFGRENGVAALEHYTQTKSVFVNTDERLANPFE